MRAAIDTIMRHLLLVPFIFAAFTATSPAPSAAQGIDGQRYASANEIPLVVIRFNQRRVFFEKPLYNAVSKAVAAKPNVVFDVVSFVPQASSSGSQDKVDANAASQQASVINTLQQIGISRQQIRVSRDIAPDTQFHEVYVYVE